MAFVLRSGSILQRAAVHDPETGAWATSFNLTLPWPPNIRPVNYSKKDLKYGQALDNRHDGLPESKTKMAKMHTDLTRMGLRFKKPCRDFCVAACVRRCKKIFEDAGELKSVALVLPDSYVLPDPAWVTDPYFFSSNDLTGHMNPEGIFDSSKFADGLAVSLVRLHGGFRQPSLDQQQMDARRREVLQTDVGFWDWFESECGWDVKTWVYGKNGHYRVPLKECDRTLVPRKLSDAAWS